MWKNKFEKFRLIYLIAIAIFNIITIILSIIFKTSDIALVADIVMALLLLFIINGSAKDISKKRYKKETKEDEAEIDNAIIVHKVFWFGLIIHIVILIASQILLNMI